VRIEFIGFKEFPPFADAMIDFPESEEKDLAEVQLITGQNGSGKTRLLCALAAACGNLADLQNRHTANDEHELFVGFARGNKRAIFDRSRNRFLVLAHEKQSTQFVGNISELIESNVKRDPAMIFNENGQHQGNIKFEGQHQSLLQWTIPKESFSAQAYRGTGRISDQKISAMQPVPAGNPISHLSFDRSKDEDALVCQSMANLKMGAAMEYQSGAPRDECRSIKITERFEKAIATVTGRPFSFQVVPSPEVHLVARWGGAVMNLATLPDGLRSIIASLVACIAKLESQFPDNPDPIDIPLILLLDEPESHLHPAWQRQLIPAAQQLFPNAQIFVVTHSPFVISSVNFGWIHVLRMGEKGIVTADDPIPCSKGDSYIDAVEDVLGLTQWYDPETETLLTEFRALRTKVLQGLESVKLLEAKAEKIGSRSDALKGVMARELHQVHTSMPEGVAQ